MPKIIIIPDRQVEKVCQDAVNFANACQSDFAFYLVPPMQDNNSPFTKTTVDISEALKYLEDFKKRQNFKQDDFILSFYNGVLSANQHGVSNLFLAGSRYNEKHPCTGIISLKYLGWHILEEKYNYELQKHSILHLIVCGMIGAYTHLEAHDEDIGCLLDKNMVLSSFNLKLERGYYLCSTDEFGCHDKMKNEKYGNSILRLCDSFKLGTTNRQEIILKNIQDETKKKPKLELSHKIALGSLVVAITVLIFGNNIWGRLMGNDDTKHKIDTSTVLTVQKNDTIISNSELPYLDIVPIIDKGLFIKYYYNDFVLGGVNLDTISINARTISGETLELSKSGEEIHMEITKEPYIEFEYKNTFYSIEITGKHYTFKSILRKDIKPTLTLKKYKEI